MAQKSDDFVADDFIPDDFIPDTEESGFLKRALKPSSHQMDTRLFNIDPEFWESIRRNMVDKIAMSEYIPESMKPGLATAADWNFVGLPSTGLELINDAAAVLGLVPRAPKRLNIEGLPNPKYPLPKFPISEPTRRAPVRQLPPGREGSPVVSLQNPYIGGPAGIQRESILRQTPAEEARLQGYEFTLDDQGNVIVKAPESPTAAETSLDTGAKAEAARQQELGFTGHEQAGGTALNIPESQRYLRGTELGVEPVSRGPLPYPLNVVPESVRPRQAQEVMRATSRGTAPPPRPATEAEKFVLENERVLAPPERPNVVLDNPSKSQIDKMVQRGYVVDGNLADGRVAFRKTQGPAEGQTLSQDILMPSATRTARQAQKNTGLNIDEGTVARAPEPLQPAVAEMIEKESRLPSIWKSVYTQLEKLSPTLAMKAKRMVHRTRQYDAQWVPQFEAAIRGLKKEQRTNFGDYVEGTLPINDPGLQRAVDIWRMVESTIGDKATAIGLRLFTDSKKWIPFQKNTQNYWPHIPSNPQAPGLVDKLIASGLSRVEAKRIEAYYRKIGELVVSPQHARVAKSNVPYRKDADAGLEHIRSMSKRISRHEEFGPRDIAGRGQEGVADLVEATKDPKLTSRFMERILDRDLRSESRLNDLLDKARMAASISHLQNFTVPNIILGQATTAQRAVNHPLAAMKEVFKLFGKRYRDETARSGAIQNFAHTLAEDLGATRFDPWQIGRGEKLNRIVAGAVGKGVAKQAFANVKRRGLNASRQDLRELSELTLTPIDDLLRQDALTQQQLDFAAGRMAEMTQGLNVPGNLPDWASEPVTGYAQFAVQLALIFKKMGYQATKNVWDTIDPRKVGPLAAPRNFAIWVGISQIAGELVGDTKQGIRQVMSEISGTGEVNPREQRWEGQRLEDWANTIGVEPEDLARIMDNASQAFFLGLPADLMQSAGYGPQGLLNAIAGPVAGAASRIGYFGYKGDIEGLAKEATKRLPVPGSTQLAEDIFSSEFD